MVSNTIFLVSAICLSFQVLPSTASHEEYKPLVIKPDSDEVKLLQNNVLYPGQHLPGHINSHVLHPNELIYKQETDETDEHLKYHADQFVPNTHFVRPTGLVTKFKRDILDEDAVIENAEFLEHIPAEEIPQEREARACCGKKKKNKC